MTGLRLSPIRKEPSNPVINCGFIMCLDGRGNAGTFTIWSDTSLICNLRSKSFYLRFSLFRKIPATYPMTPMELELPELDGKTVKMYR